MTVASASLPAQLDVDEYREPGGDLNEDKWKRRMEGLAGDADKWAVTTYH